MERHAPVIEKLTTQISTLLEKYTLQQDEIRRIEQEKSILAQALEEKNAENKSLYNELAQKEKELESLLEHINKVLGTSHSDVAGGGTTTY
ncbi:MAG: hypothetical protein K2M51_00220 [Helicobacter sp.]|nr:hypothetical protein [Helicobacter sp.]MDE6044991.1 hypothetical protein [Helicobacter sp.]MDE7195831.1 hypothetical protein [Helicobacter sp.]MDE7447463.1 hypothetical protein [Helicobacter sp.]